LAQYEARPDDKVRDGPLKVCVFTIQPPNAAASPRTSYWT